MMIMIMMMSMIMMMIRYMISHISCSSSSSSSSRISIINQVIKQPIITAHTRSIIIIPKISASIGEISGSIREISGSIVRDLMMMMMMITATHDARWGMQVSSGVAGCDESKSRLSGSRRDL